MQTDFETCQDSLFKVEESNAELQASNKTLYAEVYSLRTKIADLQSTAASAKKERRGRASRLQDTSQIEPFVSDEVEVKQQPSKDNVIIDGESSLEEVPLVPASDHEKSFREKEEEECAEDN